MVLLWESDENMIKTVSIPMLICITHLTSYFMIFMVLAFIVDSLQTSVTYYTDSNEYLSIVPRANDANNFM